MKEIQLTQGQVALVDDEDFEWLNQWKWFAHCDISTGNCYAVRNVQKGEIGYIRGEHGKIIRMPSLIMNAPKNKMVDHINHNTLDNRKSNLRIVSNRQNQQNQKRKCTSKYPGVCWIKSRQRWVSYIRINSKKKFLGYFDDEREAAKAYERACRELAGEELVCKMGCAK